MVDCILCLKVASINELVKVDERIDDSTSLEEAIRTNIPSLETLIFTSDKPNHFVCNSCFECFKSFYSLLSRIRNNYTETKIKAESFPINFCEISDEVIAESDAASNVTNLHEDEVFKYTADESLETDEEAGSDFDWELEESLKQNWDDTKGRDSFLDQTRAKKRKYSDNEEIESSTSVRYIRKCDATPEILASNKPFVTIDGVLYKIPKKPLKVWKQKTEKATNPPDKRPHRSNDPEGEQKIRDFVNVKCHICDETFDAFWRVRKHFLRFHPEQKPFLICCNKKFTRRYALLDHIEWHDRSKIHSCQVCGKEYKTKKILQQHINIVHLKIIPNHEFMCTHCGKIFKTSSALNLHQNVVHKDSDGRTFECYICHRESFKNEYTLLRHMKYLHDSDSPKYKTTICHICSSILKVVSMKYHMQAKHSNEIKEKIKCEICDHWIVKSSLRQHMEKHKNNTGAECDVCGKFFKSKLSVYKHKTVVHSTNFKFQCTYCDKKFHREVKLKEHVAVRHTRDFPFKCRVNGCGRGFRAEANWKIHEKKAHPDEYEKYFKPHYLRSPTHQSFGDESSNNNVEQNEIHDMLQL